MAQSQELSGHTTLKEIVHSYKLWMEDYGDAKYDRYLDLTIRVVNKMNINHLRQTRVKRLTIDTDLNLAQLPPDMVSINFIAINMNGRLFYLTENKHITIPSESDCGEISRDVTMSNENVDSSNYYMSYFNGYSFTPMYGMSGGYDPIFYRIDERNNRVIFEGYIDDTIEIILEYTSSGVGYSDDSLVPLSAKEAIISGLRGLLAEADPTIPANEKIRIWRNHTAAVQDMIVAKHRFNIQQWESAMFRSQRRGIRR